MEMRKKRENFITFSDLDRLSMHGLVVFFRFWTGRQKGGREGVWRSGGLLWWENKNRSITHSLNLNYNYRLS